MDQIYNELDEIEKVVYLHEGKFDIGYEINRKRFYVVRFEKTSIAEFEMVYERRIYFQLRSYTVCKGVFIRKIDWKRII
jgi:hypothetical protein